MDRALHIIDHLLEQDFRLEPRDEPTENLAFEHQAKPPLTSAILLVKPLRAAEHDSGGRRSPLPGLRYRQSCLRPDRPGLSVPVSGMHVPLHQGQDGPLLKNMFPFFPGHYERFLPAANMPHSPVDTSGRVLRPVGTVTHETAPALGSPTTRSTSVGARPVSLPPFRFRTAISANEDSARDFFPAPRSDVEH